ILATDERRRFAWRPKNARCLRPPDWREAPGNRRRAAPTVRSLRRSTPPKKYPPKRRGKILYDLRVRGRRRGEARRRLFLIREDWRKVLPSYFVSTPSALLHFCVAKFRVSRWRRRKWRSRPQKAVALPREWLRKWDWCPTFFRRQKWAPPADSHSSWRGLSYRVRGLSWHDRRQFQKCVDFFIAAQPVPAVCAFFIARSIACGATVKPNPRSPSTTTVLGDSCTTRTLGLALMRLAFQSRT